MECNRHFTLCECGEEALLLTKFDDEVSIYMSIYKAGQFNEKPSILDRLKYCWYHLRTGKKYEDQLVLSKTSAIKLINWINSNVQN